MSSIDDNKESSAASELSDKSREFFIEEPKRPQDNSASNLKDYFYFASTNGLVMYPGSEKPIKLNQVDFCFGEDTGLEYDFLQGGKKPLTEVDFLQELNQPNGRLLTWDSEKGDILVEQYIQLLANSKKALYISCHGDSYDDGKEGKFWGLDALDMAYGADRVIKSAVNEGYDLIVMTACNPDGLSLEIEKSSDKRPIIMRFNTDNSYRIPKNIEPIVVVHAIQ